MSDLLERTIENTRMYQAELNQDIEEKMKERRAANPNLSKESPPEQEMFNMITNTVIDILSSEDSQATYRSLEEKMRKIAKGLPNEDPNDPNSAASISNEICQLISTSVVVSVVSAIGFYDLALKTSLEKDFEAMVEIFNRIESDIEVLKAKLSDIQLSHMTPPGV